MIRFLVILFLLLGACATKAGYRAKVLKWKGASETALVQAFGTPDGFYEAEDGSRHLTYKRGRSAQYEMPETKSGTLYGGGLGTAIELDSLETHSIRLWCHTTYIVVDGVIARIRWKGNDCRA